MENKVLELKFDYENTGNCRTHYNGKYNGRKYNIVILHNNGIDEICTATKDGEPNAPLKEGIKVVLDGKFYKVVKVNGYSVLKEAKRV